MGRQKGPNQERYQHLVARRAPLLMEINIIAITLKLILHIQVSQRKKYVNGPFILFSSTYVLDKQA